MEQRLKILFWLYRSKMNEKGLAPIYLRLTIAGKKTEIATGHFARPEKCVSHGVLPRTSLAPETPPEHNSPYCFTTRSITLPSPVVTSTK